jgi:hypothetical protein
MTAHTFDAEGREAPKVYQVWTQVRRPKGSDHGQSALGYFTIDDGVVVMTDARGKPAKDAEGKTYSQKLKDGESAKLIAGRLTRELRTALRGGDAAKNGFDRPVEYPKSWNSVV